MSHCLQSKIKIYPKKIHKKLPLNPIKCKDKQEGAVKISQKAVIFWRKLLNF